MIEAKMKEQAIFKLYKKYEFLNCKIEKNIICEEITPPKKWILKICNENCECSFPDKKKKKKLIIV